MTTVCDELPWLVHGADAFVIHGGGLRRRVERATIERVTASTVALSNGDRFRRDAVTRDFYGRRSWLVLENKQGSKKIDAWRYLAAPDNARALDLLEQPDTTVGGAP